MKKKIAILVALTALLLGVLKIKQSIMFKIKAEPTSAIKKSQDNRDPKDILSSEESRKRRRPDELQK